MSDDNQNISDHEKLSRVSFEFDFFKELVKTTYAALDGIRNSLQRIELNGEGLKKFQEKTEAWQMAHDIRVAKAEKDIIDVKSSGEKALQEVETKITSKIDGLSNQCYTLSNNLKLVIKIMFCLATGAATCVITVIGWELVQVYEYIKSLGAHHG